MRPILVPAARAVFLAACSPASVRQGTYEAAYQKGCINQEGKPNCDPSHSDYDAYRRQRDNQLKTKP